MCGAWPPRGQNHREDRVKWGPPFTHLPPPPPWLRGPLFECRSRQEQKAEPLLTRRRNNPPGGGDKVRIRPPGKATLLQGPRTTTKFGKISCRYSPPSFPQHSKQTARALGSITSLPLHQLRFRFPAAKVRRSGLLSPPPLPAMRELSRTRGSPTPLLFPSPRGRPPATNPRPLPPPASFTRNRRPALPAAFPASV